MMLRVVRFHLFISLLVIAPIFAQNEDAEWFESDEESTPSTTSTTFFGNRGSTTARYVPRTTRYSLPPPPTFTTTNNLSDAVATILKNFAKFATLNRLPIDNEGNEYFADVLSLEIFTMATGNHFVVPPPEDKKLAGEQQEYAEAAVGLWLDIYCAGDVDAIFDKVVRETVVQYRTTRELLAANKMQEILRTLWNRFNDTIAKDSFLSSMYVYNVQHIKYRYPHLLSADAKQKVYFPLDEVTRGTVDSGTLDAWVNDLDIRKFLIHRGVLNMRKESGRQGISIEEKENSTWIRTVLKMAQQKCCIFRMQNIYNAALNETARNFDVADFPWGSVRLFVHKLNEFIEADGMLKNEWTVQNNIVREELYEIELQVWLEMFSHVKKFR